jgi:hypothetical protein
VYDNAFARPYGPVSQGLGETSAEAHTRLLKQLHGLAVAIGEAKARGDVQGVRNLYATFQAVAANYRALGSGDLTALDRLVLSVGNTVGNIVPNVGKELWKLALPLALIAGAVLIFTNTVKGTLAGRYDA